MSELNEQENFGGDMAGAVSVLNLSGIYDQETFYKDVAGVELLDLKDISGTNCMCDDAAKAMILGRITVGGKDGAAAGAQLPYGLHFIDNGNYHYMSALYLSLIKEPFSLVVLDHHPDMQRPMFDILSCGGWVLEVLEKNEYVRDVHIIGADRKLIEKLDPEVRKSVKFYDIEDVFSILGNESNTGESRINLPSTEYPVYLSIDKDVIRREELTTNWDQGDATTEQVLGLVKALLPGYQASCGIEDGKDGEDVRLLGIDICGECAPDQEDCDLDEAIAQNDDFNRKMLSQILI